MNWFWGDFGAKKIFEKKSCQNFPKIPKNAIFFKFRLWVCGRNRPEIGRYVAGRSALPKILAKIFFIPIGQKLRILSQKNDPPQRKMQRVPSSLDFYKKIGDSLPGEGLRTCNYLSFQLFGLKSLINESKKSLLFFFIFLA